MGIIDLLRPAFGLIPEVQPAKVTRQQGGDLKS